MTAANQSGSLFQDMVKAALNAKRFQVSSEVSFDECILPGKRTRVDFVVRGARPYPKGLIVSAKYQSRSGSVEQKIVYEVMNLKHFLPLPAVLVIGGEGYSHPAICYARQAVGGSLVAVFNVNEFMAWAFTLPADEDT